MGNLINNYLRGCIEKISKQGKDVKDLMRNNFNIAMPQTS